MPNDLADNSKLGASANTLRDMTHNNSNTLEKQSRQLDTFQ